MKQLSKEITHAPKRPVKVLQFGEGNFLRAFVDYMLDILNEKTDFNGNAAVIKPIPYGNTEPFIRQDCQYTVSLREEGVKGPHIENRIITCIDRIIDSYTEYEDFMALARLDSLEFIVSNTTEAGIVYDGTECLESEPPFTYPGKLTKFLYARFRHFYGNPDKGLIILPVELIEDNGDVLKETVMKLSALWNLEPEFLRWIKDSCIFCNTLVDRIVTGYPRDEYREIWNDLGYEDQLLDTAEPFALWVIEPERSIEQVALKLPFDKAGLPVIYTDNHKPYKTRKVRILNGTQSGYVLAAYLAGYDYVLDAVKDSSISSFIEGIMYEEIIPTLLLPKDDLKQFAATCIKRFHNPYIHHSLLAISLNSVSKWKTRCLPSLLAYEKEYHRIPKRLAFSLAALLAFYSGTEIRDGVLIGHRPAAYGSENLEEYLIRDSEEVLDFFALHSSSSPEAYTAAVLGNVHFWERDLRTLSGLESLTTSFLKDIQHFGMKHTLETHFYKEVS